MTRFCTQSKKPYEDILTSLDHEKFCIAFWVKMKKHGEISTYFCLKHHCGKEVWTFFRTVYPNKNHVTTHPDLGRDYFLSWVTLLTNIPFIHRLATIESKPHTTIWNSVWKKKNIDVKMQFQFTKPIWNQDWFPWQMQFISTDVWKVPLYFNQNKTMLRITFKYLLALCILMDFPIHIDTINMWLPSISFADFCFNISKQCRPWWNAALCCISSGSSLFVKVPV